MQPFLIPYSMPIFRKTYGANALLDDGFLSRHFAVLYLLFGLDVEIQAIWTVCKYLLRDTTWNSGSRDFDTATFLTP